ncbi:MAG: hypothetical protein CMG35_10220 [Candidatus Marinimicrobia bacterium]|nr:hypothetical protein [Candidatus Neomarinimicrobiota bacterium]MBO03005.1 hypothetical protein [Candidatus Neomarinimicrobiota bacterium]|tara:strand:+ start:178 stop:402 length:225 start_codon:yes stop_codon:yes gene_type:complete
MRQKYVKVHWETEELDRYYRKNHYPEKVWKDNEGMPFGIYLIDEDDFGSIDYVEWFRTEEERDKEFNELIKEEA